MGCQDGIVLPVGVEFYGAQRYYESLSVCLRTISVQTLTLEHYVSMNLTLIIPL